MQRPARVYHDTGVNGGGQVRALPLPRTSLAPCALPAPFSPRTPFHTSHSRVRPEHPSTSRLPRKSKCCCSRVVKLVTRVTTTQACQPRATQQFRHHQRHNAPHLYVSLNRHTTLEAQPQPARPTPAPSHLPRQHIICTVLWDTGGLPGGAGGLRWLQEQTVQAGGGAQCRAWQTMPATSSTCTLNPSFREVIGIL